MVHEVTSLNEFKAILNESSGQLVVVDFTAKWCPPCRHIGPVFVAFSEKPENKGVLFLKVDVDEANDVAMAYGIKVMPTFMFFKNGEKVDEFSGASEERLKQMLFQHKL